MNNLFLIYCTKNIRNIFIYNLISQNGIGDEGAK